MATSGKILALSVGGVAGVNARYWLGVWINRCRPLTVPWPTFTIMCKGVTIGFSRTSGRVGALATLPSSGLMILVGFLSSYPRPSRPLRSRQ